MKSTLSTIAAITLSSVVFFTMAAPAHASIFGVGDNFIKTKIDASKGNAFQNRDNRNQLLEKIRTGQQTPSLTPEERQSLLLQDISVTISNLQNIHDRIDARATEEAASGTDVSGIKALLSTASDGLEMASSSIADIVASSTATSTAPYDARPDIIDVIAVVTSAKNTLQQALTILEQSIQ